MPVSASPNTVERRGSDAIVLAQSVESAEFVSCPTPVLTAVVADPPCPVGNTHSMVTRAKARIFKPKIFSFELQECEP